MASRPEAEIELVKMAVLARRSGVPTPTIKHYLREGIITGPAVRTSRTMAYYDARNVARIQTIKRLQTERYLPLHVIAELLEPAPSHVLRMAKERGQAKSLAALAPAVTRSVGHRRKRADVLKFGGVSARELALLERAGVLTLLGTGPAAGYAGLDTALLDVVGDVRRAGFGAVFPIELVLAYQRAVTTLLTFEIEQFRTHALEHALPTSLPIAAQQAMAFGERLLVTLRARVLPTLLLAAAAPPGPHAAPRRPARPAARQTGK